jgi:hypothetical protein
MEYGKILLDSPADLDATQLADFLERNGHPVEVCHGPEQGTLCPILGGSGCGKLADARGIIFLFDLDRPQHRAILQKYGEAVPDEVIIRVVVQPGQREKYRDLLRPFLVWEHEPSMGELDGFAALVEAADLA